MPLPRVEDSSDFLCPDLVNTIFAVEISQNCRWSVTCSSPESGRTAGVPADETEMIVMEKNCAENTLEYSEYSREIKIFDDSCGTSQKAQNEGGPDRSHTTSEGKPQGR
jgi:hypothetical protein